MKEYKSRLVVFPKKAGKPKSGDATVSCPSTRFQPPCRGLTRTQGEDLTAHITRDPLPLPAAYEAEAPRKISDEEKEFNAFRTLRVARSDARNAGKREAREKARLAAEESKK